MLEKYIRQKLKTKDILLMTHIVIGYPSVEASMEIVAQMVDAGVDLMELQIPFSEPMADGPVILKANQKALDQGVRVDRCLRFGQEAVQRFPIPFLLMTYYNILYNANVRGTNTGFREHRQISNAYEVFPVDGSRAGSSPNGKRNEKSARDGDIPAEGGVSRFVTAMSHAGIAGAIVPDLPPEEGGSYIKAMKMSGLSPVHILTPTTPVRRMEYLASCGSGFMYCTARKGVTGGETIFSGELETYLARCRAATSLPLALGFGVKDGSDVNFLRGRVDIAVIGSQTIRVVDEKGVKAAGAFLRELAAEI